MTAGQWTPEFVDALPDSSFAFIDASGGRHLPYKAADGRVSLPQLRNALAGLSDVAGLDDVKRTELKTTLQTALQASDSADDVVLQTTYPIHADATTNELPQRMMLLRAGTFNTSKYGTVPIKTDNLQRMAANFKAGLGMAGDGSTGIPVDYAHKSDLNAAAWIKDMAVEGDELWATQIEWSTSGKQAILGKEYKCLSSDFYPSAFGEWVDPESGARAKDVIVGAALTNRPLFTGNQPVTASESEQSAGGGTKTVIHINASQIKETSMDLDQLRVKAAADVSGAEQRFLQAHAADLSADERTKFELVTASAEEKPKVIQASEVKGDEGLVAIQASELKSLTDKVATVETKLTATERETVKASVLAHVKRGAIKADRANAWTDRVMAADEAGRKEILADLSALSANPVLAKEQGSGDGDESSTAGAREQLMAAATKIVKDSGGKTDIKAAYAIAKEANPELVAQSAAEAKGGARMIASDAEFAAAGVNKG